MIQRQMTVFTGSLVRRIGSQFDHKVGEEVLILPERIQATAKCHRCGCQLSQYRPRSAVLCCSCERALNPLFHAA